jgi:hypothetical protein
MKFAYYTTFFNETASDRTSLFCIWLYYLLKSGNVDTEFDIVYVITNEETNKQINGSNLYKFLTQAASGCNRVKFINIEKPETDIQGSFVKYFPPVLDILCTDKPDYIFYSDINNLITRNIRDKFENKEDIPSAYVIFEKNVTDENDFSYIKNTEWYSKNKEIVDKFPAINNSLFCIKNGTNELALLKSIFEHVASGHWSHAINNYVLYSYSQYISEKCYIELNPELFFGCVEINKLDSKKEITLLRDIDSELINETLLISLICRLEKL